MSFAILIPCHDEAETIKPILDEIKKVMQEHQFKIVIVDDGSQDTTAHIAKQYTSDIIHHPVCKGVGAATKTGLQYISRMWDIEYVIKMDGDGQHSVNFLPLVAEALDQGCDFVVCSRFHHCSAQLDTDRERIMLNLSFKSLVNTVTGWSLADVRTGFMGFRAQDICRIAHRIILEGYGIPMELILRLWQLKPHARIAEFAHPADYRSILSKKIAAKLASKTVESEAERFLTMYRALIRVLDDMRVSTQDLLRVNGYAHH